MNCCPPRSPGREEEQANPGEHAQHDLELQAREPCRAVDTDSAAGPRPWPAPACTAPSAPSSSLPPSGHICRARMDQAPRQRAVRPPGSPAGIRRLASEHGAPVATAVDDQRVTGPSAQRAGCTRWRVLARRTGPHQRYHNQHLLGG